MAHENRRADAISRKLQYSGNPTTPNTAVLGVASELPHGYKLERAVPTTPVLCACVNEVEVHCSPFAPNYFQYAGSLVWGYERRRAVPAPQKLQLALYFT